MKGRKSTRWFDDLAQAFVRFVYDDNRPEIEYAELVADKGYDSDSRDGERFTTGADPVAEWLRRWNREGI